MWFGMWWYVVVCGGMWWYVVVCGGMWWYVLKSVTPENAVFWDEKLSKITTVCPKCASWRSNQEWRTIGADKVIYI